ncbi:MAG: N5-carboxyaminoimidazole ribonucleotide synthase [Hyphobacterium sp.]|nr:MAG: N5-carboxyaminoimidazole ribonucleotide synthase [Hyphobacterium sp.]
MDNPLPPGSVIGILGGGQLGRMLALSASRLGFDTHIFDPAPNGPAARVAARSWAAPWDDDGAVEHFASKCDAITFEFENIPASALAAAASKAPVRPGRRSLELTQDRLIEKQFIRDAGCQTVDFADVNSISDLEAGLSRLGRPAILKTRRFGYDGKGQIVIRDETDLETAWRDLGEQPAILEAFSPFQRELSIVAARAANGEMAIYPLAENSHEGGILRLSKAPAHVDSATENSAIEIARAIGAGLGHIGVFAVELFDVDGQLIVNEIAPRVHNTGHWTMDACACSQFEQHMRAVAGWSLGDTIPHSACEMTNLIGGDVTNWQGLASDAATCLHLYGKTEARAGRKMGHINRLFPLND